MRKNFLIALLEEFNPEDIGIISSDDKILEGIKPAFGSPGGKFFVAGKLVALFPEHESYVEPFIGGGSVLFRKKKTESEFINDKDEEIYFLFKFMQDLTDQQLEALNKKDWTTKKETFNSLLQSYKESPDKDPIGRFYQVTYLKAASDAGEMSSYDDRAEGEIMKLTERLMKLKEHLSGVTIENSDYKDFVKKHSSAESFTFLDPPYPLAKMNWKWCPTQEEFESFTKTIPGKWMVTYEVCDGWKESKYYRKILSQYNLAAPSAGHMTRKSELIVTNYPMKENTSFLESDINIEDAKEIIEFFSMTDIFKENTIIQKKQIGNFALYHQWWKVKHLEGKQLDSFIIATDLKTDLFLDKNPLNEDFKESIFYIRPSKYEVIKVNESTTFVAPVSELNMTERPSWMKVLDIGKISILESNELEKIIEISGSKLKGRFVAKREDKDSDFWTLKKI
jgi:site-specific DNA-adenine methylase